MTNDPRTIINRPDGRPEAYDCLPENTKVGCIACLGTLRERLVYGKGEAFMVSPIDAGDGNAHWACLYHLPDNVVIYDPATNLCRDKTGQNVWEEK